MAIKTKLLTISEWYEWAYNKFGHDSLSGLVGLEQAMFQSKHNKVCIDCLSTDNLVLNTKRLLVKSTDFYMCQECLDCYANKS